MPTTPNQLRTITVSFVNRLKREAKVVHRQIGITHSQALDRIAAREGFSNWSRLMQYGPAPTAVPVQRATPIEHPFSRTAAEMRALMRSTGRSESPKASEVEDLSVAFVSSANAVRYAISFMEGALSASRFVVHSRSVARIEMRNHLPYCIHEAGIQGKWLLVNRQYKPVGNNKPYEWVDYSAFRPQHFALGKGDATQVSHPAYLRSGGLYGDGCTPWSSRADAAGYVERLKRLLEILERNPARQTRSALPVSLASDCAAVDPPVPLRRGS